MRLADQIRLSAGAVFAHRLRSSLTALGIAVGIAAVVLLTSIGEGVQRFVLSEFTQFGTTVLSVNPGRNSTFGASVGIFGTVRPLTLEDVEALERIPGVIATEGLIQGNAEVEGNGRARRTTVLGVGADMPTILKFEVSQGRFLPDDDPRRARAFAVLGSKLRDELFGAESPLGELVRVGGRRYRVVGVMESKGQFLGFDLDDAIYLPAARGLELFDREGLMEAHVYYSADADPDAIATAVRRTLIARHDREDFTLTTQDQMLEALGGVLEVLKAAVGALGGISLFVGAVGIFTMSTIAVRERTAEIGLLRTLGAPRKQILLLFLAEASLLAGIGGLGGLGLGIGAGVLLGWIVPALPISTPWIYAIAAEVLALAIGLLAGIAPALRAASLDPIDALRTE